MSAMSADDVLGWCDDLLQETPVETERVFEIDSMDVSTLPILVHEGDNIDGDCVLDKVEPSSSNGADMVVVADPSPVAPTPTVAPTAGEGQSATPQPAKFGEEPWRKTPVYKNWVPHVSGPLEKLRQKRGPWLRPLQCATLFGGLSPERKVAELFGIPCKWRFTLDKKDAAIAFSERNFERAEFHFVEALDIIGTDGARDLYSGVMVDLKRFEGQIDVLLISTSCKPYSTVRSSRHSEGTEQHEDSRLQEVFHHVLKVVKPAAWIYEQVFGFALPESKKDTQSPLQKMLLRIETESPEYQPTVFFADGKLLAVLVRHRVYVVGTNVRAGGRISLEALKHIVKVSI